MPLLRSHCRRRDSLSRAPASAKPAASALRVCRQQSPFAYPGWTSREQREAGREAVEEVAAPDRSDLSGAERSREWDRAEQVLHHAGVVVGHGEEVTAAPVACEQQCRLGVPPREHLPEILVGGPRVTDVELHGLTHRDLLADGQRARALVGTEQV